MIEVINKVIKSVIKLILYFQFDVDIELFQNFNYFKYILHILYIYKDSFLLKYR